MKIKIVKVRQLKAQDIESMILTSDPWRKLRFTKKNVKAIARSSKNKIIYAAKDGGRIIGVAILAEGFFGGCYLNNLVVDHNYRSRGVGRELILASERYVFSRYKNYYLCVSSFNKSAEKFYKKLGFKKIGRLEKFFVSEHDEIIYRKTTGPLRR